MSNVVLCERSGAQAVAIDDVVSEGRRSTTAQSKEVFPAARASAAPVDGTGYRVDGKWLPLGAQTGGAGLP
jgi:hypothetical protein